MPSNFDYQHTVNTSRYLSLIACEHRTKAFCYTSNEKASILSNFERASPRKSKVGIIHVQFLQ